LNKPFARPLSLATLAVLSLALSGCIVLPVGHRHGRGHHVAEQAVVVVPVDRDHRHGNGRGRRY